MLRACHHHPYVELCLRVTKLQVVFSIREMGIDMSMSVGMR